MWWWGTGCSQERTMDHPPQSCDLCLRNNRLMLDPEGGLHCIAPDVDDAFPPFRLCPFLSDRP